MLKHVKDPRSKYNEIVKKNLELVTFDEYRDPDQLFEEEIIPVICVPNESRLRLKINMASDGLCSHKKICIVRKNRKEIKDTYRLLQENMFECLVWPAYAVSINQMRSNKSTFNDRLDLTLIDIQKFYEIVRNKRFSIELII